MQKWPRDWPQIGRASPVSGRGNFLISAGMSSYSSRWCRPRRGCAAAVQERESVGDAMEVKKGRRGESSSGVTMRNERKKKGSGARVGWMYKQFHKHYLFTTMLKRVFWLIFSFTNKIQRKARKPLQIKGNPCKHIVCRGLRFESSDLFWYKMHTPRINR